MQRALGTIAAVLVAALVAFLFLRREASPDASSAPIERLIAEGRFGDARAELARTRTRMDAATADYLDGLMLLAEAKDPQAAELLERARRVRPNDWRIVSAAAAATANSGRHREALAMVESYVTAAPDDERGLALVAQFRLDERAGPPNAAAALAALDRLAALPARVALAGDPTAVPATRIRFLRVKALVLLGRGFDAYGEATALVRDTPQDSEAWYLLAEAARIMTPPKPDESLDAFKRALAVAPTNRRYGEQFAMTTLEFVIAGTESDRNEDAMQVVDMMLARHPNDVALLILKARLLAHGEQSDYRRMDAAADIYNALRRRDAELTTDQKLAVRRNLAVYLFDVKRGGRPGEFTDDAYELLKEYFRLGGKDDAKLHDVWETLEKQAKEKQAQREQK